MEFINTTKETAIQTVYKYAGSSGLKTQMKKQKINYTKVEKGARVSYILRHKDFGRIEVRL